MAGSERRRELRRRKTRKIKVAKLVERSKKASAEEKKDIVRKLRMLTPGADIIIAREGLA
ncbi:MAG: DUF6800 family protein [Planctomycetota bacterium]